jgi:hypothetical protein
MGLGAVQAHTGDACRHFDLQGFIQACLTIMLDDL